MQLAHELVVASASFNPRTDVPATPTATTTATSGNSRNSISTRQWRPATSKQVRKHVSLMEFANELDVETAGDDAEEIWVLGTELFPYEDHGEVYNELEGKDPVSEPYHYAEWDYQIQLERPAWATVLEKRAKAGDLDRIDDIAATQRTIGAAEIPARRTAAAGRAAHTQAGRRRRAGYQRSDTRHDRSALGQQPDQRIMMRSVRKVRDISVMVLLDLSESTNDKVSGPDYSVLDLQREATVLLADAIHKIGDPFAIHGFCSDGRHNVEYSRFKDFDQL